VKSVFEKKQAGPSKGEQLQGNLQPLNYRSI